MENELVKNSIHTVIITGSTGEGDGVARIDGRVIFVKGAIEGETCEVKILKATKSVAYARLERILTPSEHRVTPECPYFGKCGGCTLMNIDYAHELELKRRRVEDAVRRIGGIDLAVERINGSPNVLRYRNKTITAVGMKNGHAVTGFFRGGTHDIVPVERCVLQTEISDRASAAVRHWMDKNRVSAYSEETGKGLVRHVFTRVGFRSGQAQVTVVATGQLPAVKSLIAIITGECPEVTSIVLNVNRTRGNTVLSGDFITLWGEDAIRDTLCGAEFSLSPRSFYQINHDQAERLYEKAVEFAGLTGSETVLDMYCGTGTITLCLARRAGRVIGAEIVREAVSDATENARRNNITNAEFICADASDAARRFLAEGTRPDVIVVDPPRKGLAADVVESLAGMSPERIVYVSCDPATLARDLARFAPLGYTAVKLEAFDMFPRTGHVETVVLLSQQRPHDKIRVELDLTELDITAAEKEATYQEIKDYILEKHGMKVSSLYIAQVKDKIGIKERINYNVSKNPDARKPQCPKEKEEAIVEALRHFGMIGA
ncbi:MAG: 23S rRNA (uracil(1939)-C(5))-methyltransferase RlmD [Oscillospiraceae bacterium]|nr:23S rRNA (uracil(1939)-C(5))-methyltransferase RlmD [Oscillospiraceae bacterium]